MDAKEIREYIKKADIEALKELNKTLIVDINRIKEYCARNSISSMYGDYKGLVSLLIDFERIPFDSLSSVTNKAHLDIVYLEKYSDNHKRINVVDLDKGEQIYFERFNTENYVKLRFILEYYGQKSVLFSSSYEKSDDDLSIKDDRLTDKHKKALLDWFSNYYSELVEQKNEPEIKTGIDNFIKYLDELSFLERDEAVNNEISAREEFTTLINARIKTLTEERISVKNMAKVLSLVDINRIDKAGLKYSSFDLYEIADSFYYSLDSDKQHETRHVIYDDDGDIIHSLTHDLNQDRIIVDSIKECYSSESKNKMLRIIEEKLKQIKIDYYRKKISEEIKQGRQTILNQFLAKTV